MKTYRYKITFELRGGFISNIELTTTTTPTELLAELIKSETVKTANRVKIVEQS